MLQMSHGQIEARALVLPARIVVYQQVEGSDTQ
jgi:hypothetical protein